MKVVVQAVLCWRSPTCVERSAREKAEAEAKSSAEKARKAEAQAAKKAAGYYTQGAVPDAAELSKAKGRGLKSGP